MPYTPTVWVDNTTLVDAAKLNHIETGIVSLSAPAPSTTPPASPADGDLWYLPADATNGVTWQFRYNASGSTYKWEFVGGPPMRAEVAADEGLSTPTGVWFDAATQGPQLQMGRSGEYLATGGSIVYCGGATGAVYIGLCMDNDTPPHSAVANLTAAGGGSTTTLVSSVKITIAAGHYAKMRYLQGSANNHIWDRWLSVVPIRVS